jgi:hypothetical protein
VDALANDAAAARRRVLEDGVRLDPKKLVDPLESTLAGVVFLEGCTGYMTWTMDKLDGGDHLVKDVGIEPKM